MKTKRQSKIFHFKRFSVQHDRCTMKVGTDAVLLGSWVNVVNTSTILDVGTGSGIIALMLAQRSDKDAKIDAIEIEHRDAEQAKENILQAPWPDKIAVHQVSLQEFNSNRLYDLIVSNPPYFISSLLPPSRERTTARHAHDLTFDELIIHSSRLLKPNGRISVILPFAEGNIFKSIAEKNHFYLIRETAFFSRKGKPQERWLFEFGKVEQPIISDQLILYADNSIKTKDYINLTKDFYL